MGLLQFFQQIGWELRVARFNLGLGLDLARMVERETSYRKQQHADQANGGTNPVPFMQFF